MTNDNTDAVDEEVQKIMTILDQIGKSNVKKVTAEEDNYKYEYDDRGYNSEVYVYELYKGKEFQIPLTQSNFSNDNYLESERADINRQEIRDHINRMDDIKSIMESDLYTPDEISGWTQKKTHNGVLYGYEGILGETSILLKHNKRDYGREWRVEDDNYNEWEDNDLVVAVYELVDKLHEFDPHREVKSRKVENKLSLELELEFSRVTSEQANQIAENNRHARKDHTVSVDYENDWTMEGIGEKTAEKIESYVRDQELISEALREAQKELIQEHDQTHLLAQEI
jgi:hypothetical protein